MRVVFYKLDPNMIFLNEKGAVDRVSDPNSIFRICAYCMIVLNITSTLIKILSFI